MAHLTISMQVAHVTRVKYSPFKSKLMLFLLISVPVIFAVDMQSQWGDSVKAEKINVATCIYLLLTVSVVCQLHFILNVVREVADALGIRIFRVKDKNATAMDN
jgi:hypothetical protein